MHTVPSNAMGWNQVLPLLLPLPLQLVDAGLCTKPHTTDIKV